MQKVYFRSLDGIRLIAPWLTGHVRERDVDRRPVAIVHFELVNQKLPQGICCEQHYCAQNSERIFCSSIKIMQKGRPRMAFDDKHHTIAIAAQVGEVDVVISAIEPNSTFPSYDKKNGYGPTVETSAALLHAFELNDDRLIAGVLPRCLTTLHRGAYGYFDGHWFAEIDTPQNQPRSLFATGFTLKWADAQSQAIVPGGEDTRSQKNDQSQRKFNCPSCGQNAWANHTAKLVCGNRMCGGAPMQLN